MTEGRLLREAVHTVSSWLSIHSCSWTSLQRRYHIFKGALDQPLEPFSEGRLPALTVSSWLSVCSRSSLPTLRMRPSLTLATASICDKSQWSAVREKQAQALSRRAACKNTSMWHFNLSSSACTPCRHPPLVPPRQHARTSCEKERGTCDDWSVTESHTPLATV